MISFFRSFVFLFLFIFSLIKGKKNYTEFTIAEFNQITHNRLNEQKGSYGTNEFELFKSMITILSGYSLMLHNCKFLDNGDKNRQTEIKSSIWKSNKVDKKVTIGNE